MGCHSRSQPPLRQMRRPEATCPKSHTGERQTQENMSLSVYEAPTTCQVSRTVPGLLETAHRGRHFPGKKTKRRREKAARKSQDGSQPRLAGGELGHREGGDRPQGTQPAEAEPDPGAPLCGVGERPWPRPEGRDQAWPRPARPSGRVPGSAARVSCRHRWAGGRPIWRPHGAARGGGPDSLEPGAGRPPCPPAEPRCGRGGGGGVPSFPLGPS